MFSVDGLVSGFDTAGIVEGALSIQKSRLDRLALQKQEIIEEQTAFKTIEGRLLGLQGSLGKILRASNNAFDNKLAVSSDEESIAVAGSSSAVPGTYRLRVTQLAQAQQVKSGGFSSRADEIGTGELTIQVGNRAETKIVIDETNNTLQGMADAINSQSEDVTAAILDDGSDSGQPLRLLLTSRHTGAQNEITIQNGLADTAALDFTEPSVQDARDAQVQIGNGEGALTISSSTNEFDDLIEGVTLDILKVDPEKEIVVTVSQDSGEVVDAIQGFVDSYNDVMDFIDTNSTFDPESNTAGLLLGNRSAANVQSAMRAAIGSVVDGVNESLRTLSKVGISTNSQGKLEFNKSKVEDIVNGRTQGVTVDDIRRLFAIDGQSDNPGIEFVLGTANTQASPRDPETGELIPYEVEINRVAEKARLEATSSALTAVIVEENNDTLDIELNGTAISVKIPHGVYSQSELVSQVETLINTSPDRKGRTVTLEVVNDRVSMVSAEFGSSSKIKVLSGNANSLLGFADEQSATGVDVAGVFRVQLPGEEDKIIEQASGNGRTLSGDSDNKYTAQLQVRSTLPENQISNTTDAHLTVTRGIGAALSAAISGLLESETGELSNTQDRFTRQIEDIDENMEQVQTRLDARRDSLLREFAALESTLAELQSVGNALSSSLVASLR